MNTRSDRSALLRSDESQQDLRECLGDALREGIFDFRFSFLRRGDTISGLSIHGFRNHSWKCLDIRASDEVTGLLWKRFSSTGDRDTTDKWNCRRVEHPGQTDFEVSFQSRLITRESADVMQSFLDRCLLQD